MARRLGEMLLEAGLITREQLERALDHQKETGKRIGVCLVELNFITEEELADFLSKKHGVPAINLRHFEIDPAVIRLVPPELCRRFVLIPVSKSGPTLMVAMSDPTDLEAITQVEFATNYSVEPVVAPETMILEAIRKYYGGEHGIDLPRTPTGAAVGLAGEPSFEELIDAELGDEAIEELAEDISLDTESLMKAAEERPIIRLVNKIIYEAVRQEASDIHIEPYEKEMRVRYRIDGVLHPIFSPPIKLRDAIVSRIKVMSRLDIAEKRLPQDGRIKMRLRVEGRMKTLDFRVSVLPTIWGEKVVIRILDPERLFLDMTKLGFEPESLERFERAITKPWGMILVTGPTGSGKTNTLYSAISRLNTTEVNILTAEDPVEFNLFGINQVQVNEAIGLTFAAALRSFLRQDPNIILVGEIRDFETAEIAIKAALTGHLVLSTLHTNDAPSTVTRLMNMGIEPFLVATSVHLIQAQRLVRRICQECKEEVRVPTQTLIEVGFTPEEAKSVKIYKGRGCSHCNNTGYRGRIGLFEVLEFDDDIRDMVLSGASALEIRRVAIEKGMITLRRSGLIKVMNGITTIEEVLRETVK
ncbi:putative type II secretion system protein HxcR [bacterium HR11]|nr:putative type II secretion system protein HxcR [bacterium HR11]